MGTANYSHLYDISCWQNTKGLNNYTLVGVIRFTLSRLARLNERYYLKKLGLDNFWFFLTNQARE